MASTGFFKPRNPEKYKGDPKNIVYRSSWEAKFMREADANPNIIQWSSEEIVIPYVSPLDNRRHRYFVDFWIKMKKRDGTIREALIEVKPNKQTKPPTPQKKPTKRYLNEVMTWGVNEAKWKAATSYCEAKDWDFLIFDEYALGIKKQ